MKVISAFVAWVLVALPCVAGAAPQRVMSLNLCADVLALQLLPRERIASVSFLAATSPLSPVQRLAQGLPTNDSQIEEIISVQPDLVLVHQYSDPRVLQWLGRLGIAVLTIELPASIDEAVAQWRRVGAALGSEPRAEALAAQVASALERDAIGYLTPPLAAVYGTNGTTQGRHSLLDDLLRASGYRNLAAELGLEALASLPLERLALAQPQLLVLARDAPRTRSLADMSLAHPVLRRLARQATVVELPGRYWSCGGPELIEALERLHPGNVGRNAP